MSCVVVIAPPDADVEARRAWSRLRARWDVAPGTESERALALAVLLDAPLHEAAACRAATAVLSRRPGRGRGLDARSTLLPIPEHPMQPITPYLIFDGDCRAAMTRYQQILGGRLELSTYKDGGQAASPETADWVMHACLMNGPRLLMASDRHPGIPLRPGNQMHLMLPCDDVESLERTYAALVEGGEATVPPHDAFWGARFGMLTDRFGTTWMLSHQHAPMEAPTADRA